MVVVPALTLFTAPVEELMVATARLLLVHIPPVFAFDKVEPEPVQIEMVPVIAAVGAT